ncbi:MAG: succinate dehydrogenase cytochrome b subunit [Candidatus Tectomicrobia bacterium]|nr:succinate dehydrogenase cytochrome b subunit [Candidatus Tectomicrobia bacterium]
MGRFGRFFQSSIGAKVTMAVTGILLFLWILGHLLGNLLIFAGRDATNAYAHGLRQMPALLWAARLGLLVVFVLHVVSAYRVWRQNRASRPQGYAVYDPASATYAGRTMMVSGVLVLLYAAYHLLHFTFGVTNPEYWTMFDPQGRPDVYSMVVQGFSNAAVSAAYIVAMALLGFHLSHGVTSFFQTLGYRNTYQNAFTRRLGPASAVVIALGFISIPLAVLSGLLKLP